jgi:tetratricopeptide (TPR) repeat protein
MSGESTQRNASAARLASERLAQAREAIAATRFEDAIGLLRALLTETADLPELHLDVLLARCTWHYYQPETAAAIEWGQRAVEHAQASLSPAHEAQARALLANVKDSAGDIEGALAEAVQALALAAPDDGHVRARAYAAISHIAQRAGEELLCFQMLKQAVDAAAGHDALRSSVLLITAAAQARFALECWWSKTLAAQAAVEARTSVVASTELNAVLGTGTNHGRGLIAEGEALLAQDRFEDALDRLSRGISEVQEQAATELADAVSLRAYCLARLGRLADALTLAQQARLMLLQASQRDPELRLMVLRSVAEVMRLAVHPQAELARIEWMEAQGELDRFRAEIRAKLRNQLSRIGALP